MELLLGIVLGLAVFGEARVERVLHDVVLLNKAVIQLPHKLVNGLAQGDGGRAGPFGLRGGVAKCIIVEKQGRGGCACAKM